MGRSANDGTFAMRRDMEKASGHRITTFGILLVPVLIIVLFMYFTFTTVVVDGKSMEPTFQNHERLLASKAYWLVGPIKKRDVVVIRGEDGSNIIKRVYGLEGDKIDFFNIPEDWELSQGEYVVPKGMIYVLGDNREVSEDSRKFGAVSIGEVLGKVITPR